MPNHEPGDGKSVLITGCSSGIGEAIALNLARNGFTVFASVRKEADRDRLLRQQIPNLLPVFPLDLARSSDIPPVVHFIQEMVRSANQPGLYALINNAGGGSIAPIELMDVEYFRVELQTRLVGSVALVQALLPLLRAGSGRIIWIATPAIIPMPYVASIHACDFAANCLARTLDLELKPWRIPSILVRCGGIKTARGLRTTGEVEEMLKNPKSDLYRRQLTTWADEMKAFDQKRTDPEEVAQTVMTALTARHPKRRYAVGYMSGAAAFLESLPQPLTDAILNMRY